MNQLKLDLFGVSSQELAFFDQQMFAPGEKIRKRCGESYSAIEIVDGKIKKPFEFLGCLWICTGISLGENGQAPRELKACRVVLRSEWKGETTTYSAKTFEWDEEHPARRPRGWNLYRWIAVKNGKTEYVMTGEWIWLMDAIDPKPDIAQWMEWPVDIVTMKAAAETHWPQRAKNDPVIAIDYADCKWVVTNVEHRSNEQETEPSDLSWWSQAKIWLKRLIPEGDASYPAPKSRRDGWLETGSRVVDLGDRSRYVVGKTNAFFVLKEGSLDEKRKDHAKWTPEELAAGKQFEEGDEVTGEVVASSSVRTHARRVAGKVKAAGWKYLKLEDGTAVYRATAAFDSKEPREQRGLPDG